MNLAWRSYGNASSVQPPVVLLHGLFGSAVQWHHMALPLSAQRQVFTVDWPNHGRSPHVDRMDYPLMADALRSLFDELHIDRAHVVGHSMGGKAGMVFACQFGQRVESLVVLDIAPVTYTDRFTPLVYAALRLNLQQIQRREDADIHLARHVRSGRLRAMLLQNLARRDTSWVWRNHWAGIAASMKDLLAFPATLRSTPSVTPTLFVRGSASGYLTAAHRPLVTAMFPASRHAEIADAGHWIHADQPAALLHLLQTWLQQQAAQRSRMCCAAA
ncbi:alpha/beta fold hydrolase [Hydrogenophaga pseudoflava]|uniref:alpha/beta fold hydrolase n=1 Tax=Hydrogenophaga pseudoflava TaxID=47421 RepID=UPI0027E53129|nr:alpha/beta fold hydrolase [Hydrogenophaga pseudoflava]MDQ7747263.1 alpha/beta fold hydrolase [Hydrogenophaga pseudoflava]